MEDKVYELQASYLLINHFVLTNLMKNMVSLKGGYTLVESASRDHKDKRYRETEEDQSLDGSFFNSSRVSDQFTIVTGETSCVAFKEVQNALLLCQG